jgi:hypothetical protein
VGPVVSPVHALIPLNSLMISKLLTSQKQLREFSIEVFGDHPSGSLENALFAAGEGTFISNQPVAELGAESADIGDCSNRTSRNRPGIKPTA